MDKYALRYTEDAVKDLMSIVDFIATDNPARAVSFVEEIKEHCESLTIRPQRKALVPDIGENVRRAVFGSYNIYYFVENDCVVIFGVIQGRRDQIRNLKGRS